MSPTEMIGYIAAFCTTISFLPQAIKVLKTRDTEALSLTMYCVFTFGVAMWLCYGILLGDKAMIAANTITIVLASSILITKIRNDLRRK